MHLYSNKRPIIFFDTEFTHIDPRVGELLSIGLVKETGEELYIELTYEGLQVHPWVKKKVLPHLQGNSIPHKEAQKELWKFIGKSKKDIDKPYLMAFVNQFDAVYWYKLFGDPKEHPAYWIPLDFASILFAHGYDPESMRKESFFNELGLSRDNYMLHNALDDARMLRDVYTAFIRKISI